MSEKEHLSSAARGAQYPVEHLFARGLSASRQHEPPEYPEGGQEPADRVGQEAACKVKESAHQQKANQA